MVTAAATPIVGGERKEQERKEGRKEGRKEQYGNGTTLSSQGALSIDDILFDGLDSILFNNARATGSTIQHTCLSSL